MRWPIPFAVAVFLTSSLLAAVDDEPRKRGGFTGATPSPSPAQKKFAPAASPTPAAKKKAKPREEEEDASAEKPVVKKKVKPPSEEDDKPTEKPAEKKRAKPRTDEDDAPAEKHVEKRKIEEPEPPAKPAKTADTENNGTPSVKQEHAPAATVAPEEIAEFAAQPPRVQALITAALELTKLNLTYTYGSADPAQGGMDCSGTMSYLLHSQGFKDVPRDSSSQYVWARKAGPFFAVVSKSAESFEFKDLQPGDLMFWTGTYETGREIPISHVMLYLGTEKKTKKRIMFGSSDGRSYAGIQRWGVSVFDFKMPKADPANPEKAKVDFVGYGRIPALRESAPLVAIAPPAPAAEEPSRAVAEPAATPKPKSGGSTKSSPKKPRKKVE
jgi:cell wall-associated NlpC family hydrolase